MVDPLGEPTRPEVRSSEHFSHDQGSSGSPKELATIAGSGGQGSHLFRLGSYVTGLYGASGPLQIIRELESHCSEQQHWDTREQIDFAEYSLRGYGSNLELISGGISGAETETEAPEKKRKEAPKKPTPENKKQKVTKQTSPEKQQIDDSTKVISSLISQSGPKATQQELDLLKNTLL